MKYKNTVFNPMRLEDIKKKLMIQSALTDTSLWNDRFLLGIIAEKDREIRRLKTQLARKK